MEVESWKESWPTAKAHGDLPNSSGLWSRRRKLTSRDESRAAFVRWGSLKIKRLRSGDWRRIRRRNPLRSPLIGSGGGAFACPDSAYDVIVSEFRSNISGAMPMDSWLESKDSLNNDGRLNKDEPTPRKAPAQISADRRKRSRNSQDICPAPLCAIRKFAVNSPCFCRRNAVFSCTVHNRLSDLF